MDEGADVAGRDADVDRQLRRVVLAERAGAFADLPRRARLRPGLPAKVTLTDYDYTVQSALDGTVEVRTVEKDVLDYLLKRVRRSR